MEKYDGYSWDAETLVLDLHEDLRGFEHPCSRVSWYGYRGGNFMGVIQLEYGDCADLFEKAPAANGTLSLDDMYRLTPRTLLSQACYLTVHGTAGDGSRDLILGIPNRDIRVRMAEEYFPDRVFPDIDRHHHDEIVQLWKELSDAFVARDAGRAEKALEAIYIGHYHEFFTGNRCFMLSILKAALVFLGSVTDRSSETVTLADIAVETYGGNGAYAIALNVDESSCPSELAAGPSEVAARRVKKRGNRKTDGKVRPPSTW